MGIIKGQMEAGQYAEPLKQEKIGLPAKLAAVQAAMDRIADIHRQVMDDPEMGTNEAQDVAEVYNTAVESIQTYAQKLVAL